MVLISNLLIIMKFLKYFLLPIVSVAAMFTSCVSEGSGESKAILPGDSQITVPAIATNKTITIYADGTWVADVTDTWLSIEPTSGKGTVDVTLSVDANLSDAEREAKIIVKGASTLTDVEIGVKQKMDRFKDVSAKTVSEALSLKEGDLAKLSECQVVALNKSGFVVSDGTSNLYVVGSDETLSLGCRLTLTGDMVAFNNLLAVQLDDAFFASEGSVSYPDEAKDVTSDASYSSDKVEYIKVTATYASGDKLSINGKQIGIIYEPLEDYSELNNHNAVFTGYYLGLGKSGHTILPVASEDLGKAEIVGKDLPYKDDFSWLDPFVEQANAKLDAAKKISDCVGQVSSSAEGCANIYTTLVNNGVTVLEELRARGYTDLNPSQKTIYLQQGYFKYGATGKSSGLVLPNFKIEGTTDLFVSLKWCSQMQGTGKIDGTQLVLEIAEGPGAIVTKAGQDKISDPVSPSQKEGEMFWNDVTFKVVGATAETRVSFHPGNEIGSKSVFRYYVDDIEVVSAAGMVDANIEVGGVENDLITFEGTPEAPVSFTVKSDADYTISTSANWLHLDVTEGVAGAESNVTLTCDASALSTLRKAEISIKSGLTTRKIQVVQSAAGQTLSPFISIIGGNSVKVKSDVTEKTFTVQANVPYQVEVVDGADWISVETVATRTLVETSDVRLILSENTASTNRTGLVRVFNASENIDAYLAVTQTASVIVLARWKLDATTMDTYKDLFGTLDGTFDKNAGDGGQYIPANNGGVGRLTYVQIDKNELDVNNAASRVTGSTGEPFVKGCWPGDYWLFTVDYEEGIPAGSKIHGYFVSRASASGMKYFLAEYLDGTEWKPVSETTTTKVGDDDITFNINHNNTANFPLDFNFTMTKPTKTMQVRVKCVANAQASGKGAVKAPNTGTVRLKGGDLSPYFEMTL